MKRNEKRFSPSICLTHDCNLNCIYCYQKHDKNHRMSLETGKKVIDWIFDNVPQGYKNVEIDFIGGEPLLEFHMIQEIIEYTLHKKIPQNIIFFATTNGTIMNSEIKDWCYKNKDIFWLGLSLDGTKETHDKNRCNSFDLIDIDFFLRTWPKQGIKMTVSEYSLSSLADDVIFLHSIGFKDIAGVNLFEGLIDWSKKEYIATLIPQLQKLVDFYVENDNLQLNQMFDKHLDYCEIKTRERKKWCGIGTGCVFFDVDGQKYPCAFITPMTFDKDELTHILETDFSNDDNFLDLQCFENCYIYPICPTCSAGNYLVNKTFVQRNKTKCDIMKLIALFNADLQGKRIVKKNKMVKDKRTYYTIEAIKKIRDNYLNYFSEYYQPIQLITGDQKCSQ